MYRWQRLDELKLMDCTNVLQSTGSFSKQSEGVVDEVTVQLPERSVVRKSDVFTPSGQQVGGHLQRYKEQQTPVVESN